MINITDLAAKEVLRLLDPRKPFLRVRVEGGGCSGLSYKLEFEEVQDEKSTLFIQNRVMLLIDPKSFLFLDGMIMDFSGGLNGTGFTFHNPNAKRSCGCGSSFNV